MDDMPRRRLPHIQREVSRHGKVLWYFRRKRGGERVRLPDDYGSADFLAAYDAALKGQAPKAKVVAERDTLAWVVEQYKRSAAWSKLSNRTRYVRDNQLRAICETAGGAPVRDITRASLQAGFDKRAEKPESANVFIKVMRVVLDHAVGMGLIDDNPARRIKLLEGSKEGVHTWTMEEIERYEFRHHVGTTARLAFDLLLYTGMRLSDLAIIGHQHVRDGTITFRPEKTRGTSGVTVTIRILPPLARSLAATRTGDMHFVVSERGTPYVKEALGNRVKKWCKEAGIPHCSAHGLRKASATRAAEAGATSNELMAMFGWTTSKEADRYTRAADRKRMGLAASQKLEQMSLPTYTGYGTESEK